jgi:hypothetical protein
MSLAQPLPNRRGPRPETIAPQPRAGLPAHIHTQVLARARTPPAYVAADSLMSVPGAIAFVLDQARAGGPLEAFQAGREFAHLHPTGRQAPHDPAPEPRGRGPREGMGRSTPGQRDAAQLRTARRARTRSRARTAPRVVAVRSWLRAGLRWTLRSSSSTSSPPASSSAPITAERESASSSSSTTGAPGRHCTSTHTGAVHPAGRRSDLRRGRARDSGARGRHRDRAPEHAARLHERRGAAPRSDRHPRQPHVQHQMALNRAQAIRASERRPSSGAPLPPA